MNELQKTVVEFMDGANQSTMQDVWVNPLANLYFSLVKEEYGELKRAHNRGDYVKMADGIADLVWVTLGLCSALGMDFQDIWDEVARSNMSKLIDMKFNKVGKIVKGDNFRPVDLESVLPKRVAIDNGKGICDELWITSS